MALSVPAEKRCCLCYKNLNCVRGKIIPTDGDNTRLAIVFICIVISQVYVQPHNVKELEKFSQSAALLDNAIKCYFSEGLVNSTRRVYNIGINKYPQFCHLIAATPTSSSELLCRFVVSLALQLIR